MSHPLINNGDWGATPPTPTGNIDNDTNPLDSWVYTQSSGTAITAALAVDATVSSGYDCVFSMASGAAGDETYLEQIVPVWGEFNRLYYYAPFAPMTIATSALMVSFINAQYLKVDGTTTTGSSVEATVSGIGSNGLSLLGLIAHPPANAAFLRVRVGLRRGGAANGATGTLTVKNVVMLQGAATLITPDTLAPDTYLPAFLSKSSGSFQIENTGSVGTATIIFHANGEIQLNPYFTKGVYIGSWLRQPEQAAPGTPVSGESIIYPKADGLWYSKDDAGVETLMSGTAAAFALLTNTAWAAKGDMVVATANDTAAILPIGATSAYPRVVGGTVVWVAASAATPAAVSTSGSTGTAANSPAADDHVHAHEAAHVNHDTTWAAKGDLLVGTANDTAAVVSIGSTSGFPRVVAGTVAWAGPSAATPAAVSTAGSTGTAANSPSADDHVHAHEAAHINHDTTWAAKGDLITGTANDTAAVTAVGADLKVLAADSAQAGGVVWDTVTGTGSVVRAGSPTLTGTAVIPVVNLTSGQVIFPAAQNASAGANTLDDYEEADFTPVVTFATVGNLAVTYTTQAGFYQKIGKYVYIWVDLVCSVFTHTTASGNLRITGLPFTASARVRPGFMNCLMEGYTKANYTSLQAAVTASDTVMQIQAGGSGQTIANLATGDVPTGTAKTIRISGFYEASA